MSCNGCRVLRKGCSESCVLRQCLKPIESVEAQGHATIFVAKFFGRAGMMSLISSVPESQRPATFKSLLYEACGRTISPVFGAVGLLCSGSWQLCEEAVETVMKGGFICPSASSPSPDSSSNSRFRLGRGYIQAPAAAAAAADAHIKREDLLQLESSRNSAAAAAAAAAPGSTRRKRCAGRLEELKTRVVTSGCSDREEVFSPSSECCEDKEISLELTLALRKKPRRISPCHSEADSDTTTDNLSISGRRSSPAALGLLH